MYRPGGGRTDRASLPYRCCLAAFLFAKSGEIGGHAKVRPYAMVVLC
jgi:hypothetical protein